MLFRVARWGTFTPKSQRVRSSATIACIQRLGEDIEWQGLQILRRRDLDSVRDLIVSLCTRCRKQSCGRRSSFRRFPPISPTSALPNGPVAGRPGTQDERGEAATAARPVGRAMARLGMPGDGRDGPQGTASRWLDAVGWEVAAVREEGPRVWFKTD